MVVKCIRVNPHFKSTPPNKQKNAKKERKAIPEGMCVKVTFAPFLLYRERV